MGVALKDLISRKEISVSDLRSKVLFFDGFNLLYQFLTTIRGPDGSPLSNSKGEVTSHLVGLFSRMTSFMESGIKPVMIFDGKAPKLKEQERERRRSLKAVAESKYSIALEEGDTESMKKFASRTTILESKHLEMARELLDLLGIPVIEAPSEGEAQAAHLVKRGLGYAVVSQDFDSLLFGSTLLIRNLSIAGRRKRVHGSGTVVVKPEIISISGVLSELGIDQDGLIVLGMLVGTDFNVGGIKGIGPKKAIKLVKESEGRFDELFENVKWSESFSFGWKEVFDIFKNMPVQEECEFSWEPMREKELRSFLLERCEFSEERIDRSVSRLLKQQKKGNQKGLGDFF